MPKGIKGFQKGYTPYNKGKKLPTFTVKHRRNIALAKFGDRNPAKRLDVKEKNRLAHLGKKHSEKTKQKMSLAVRRGEKSHLWQGGISFESYTVDWTETLKRSIRERDKYLCQMCKLYGLNVHHIDYDKKNCNPNNLITLCRGCHSKTNYNRQKWKEFFNN